VLLKVMPTFGAAAGAVLAPSGRWVIRVTCNEPAVVDAWIRRNDTPFGFKGRSRQSRFLDPDHERFDKFGRLLEEDPAPPSLVRREGSLNGLATGHETIVIGASRRSAMGYILPTAYTAHGLDGGKSPMMVAPGDHSLAQPGILAAGTRSGSVVCLNGTSVAAPAVTRALALQLVNTRQIPAALASISRRLAPSGRFLRTGGWELAQGPEKPEALR
jgi:hypothetical protein